jgi:quinolinate synthase
MDKKELQREIEELKREKDAVILGHYYQREEIQEVSDYVGDSLALAQEAQRCEKSVIVFCGVHFMAETAKILNPTRKVLLPDMEASCSLAESCKAEDLRKLKGEHPGAMVVSYVNCTAEVKGESDLICTSGNAEKLIRALPEEQEIIFAPDKNLGGYINGVTGRKMLLWDGVCTVHDALVAENVLKMKMDNRDAKVIAHPECNRAVLEVSDFVGSTKAMLRYIGESGEKRFIVATERGMLYEMKRMYPDREFLEVGSGKDGCACTDCAYMKLNTLEKLRDCLRSESPEIVMDEKLIEAARKPIERMLEMSRELGIIK